MLRPRETTPHPAPLVRRLPERARSLLPGLAATAAAVLLSFALHRAFPAVSPLTWAVIGGALLTNLGGHVPALHPGTRLASRRLLRVGVVLLGFQLAVGQVLALGPAVLVVVVVTVGVTFGATLVVGRLLALPAGQVLLVATGSSVCGAAAVAAMDGAVGSDGDDVLTAVAVVTVYGTAAMVVLPLAAGALGLDPRAFGVWAGASVHEVSQVVAAATPVAGALTVAVGVKLTRVALLAPLVAAVTAVRRRRSVPGPGRRPPWVPLFVVGFLAAAAARSTLGLPPELLGAADGAQRVLLTAAMFGLGTGVDVAGLRRTGGRVAVLGLVAWAVVAGVALLGVLVAVR